jgi:inosose dehydratase
MTAGHVEHNGTDTGSSRLGHTGITWSFDPAGARQAITDVAATGYRGIELFGFVLDVYPGGVPAVADDLAAAGLEYAGSYCSVSLVDPTKRSDDLASIRRWASQVRALGADVAVVGPDQRTRDSYGPEDYTTIVDTLDEIGRECAELGVQACFHPHTGTPVETLDQITQVMDRIDTSVVFMAPDTGQIAKGGADPVALTRTYRELIRHIHLKDYVGGESSVDWEGSDADRTGYLDYLPLGEGVVDLAAIVDELGPQYPGWLMVELDGTERAPRPPREAAEISKRRLDQLVTAAAGSRVS